MNQFGTLGLAGVTGTVHALLMMRVMGIGWVSCALMSLSLSCGGESEGQVARNASLDCVFTLPSGLGSRVTVGARASETGDGWRVLFWITDPEGTGQSDSGVVETREPWASYTFESERDGVSVAALTFDLDIDGATATLSQARNVLASDISCTPRR